MQFVVMVFLATAASSVAGAIDGDLIDFEHDVGRLRSPLPLDLNDEGLANKMVGGYVAAKNAFPFVAYVRYYGGIFCTGSLVHPRWVLTVDCSIPLNGLEVVLGQFDRKKVDESTQIIKVSKIIKLNDTVGDTYLYKLASRAYIRGDAVGVVDMVSSKPVMNRALRNEMECVQVAWGRTRRNYQFVTARFLRATGVEFVNDTEVIRRGYESLIQYGHIGTEAEYRDECRLTGMCYGDEGAPVVCRRRKGTNWILTAMYSFSKSWDGCMTGVKASKNVFTLYDWVQSTTAG